MAPRSPAIDPQTLTIADSLHASAFGNNVYRIWELDLAIGPRNWLFQHIKTPALKTYRPILAKLVAHDVALKAEQWPILAIKTHTLQIN